MDFRGLSRSEQRRLNEIEQHLDAEAPEVVSAFRATPVPAEEPGGRGGFVAVAALIALVGLLAGAPLVVLCAMAGAVAALLLPRPDWMTANDGDAAQERGPEPPGPVPLG